MQITHEEVARIAHLARLDITDVELDRFAGQIDTILQYVATLNLVDTQGVAPTSHAIALTNAFREDVADRHLPVEKALQNAPQQGNGSFVVPRVIG